MTSPAPPSTTTDWPIDMPSRFLPDAFDASRPLAVIAGQGLYPQLAVERARTAGLAVRLIAFEGETRADLVEAFPEAERETIKVGQVGRMLKALQKLGVGYVLMAGQITPRKLFKGLHPDLKAVAILASLKEKNAESIFGAIAREIEKLGILQLDARAFLDDSLADKDVMAPGRYQPDAQSIDYGVRMAKEMARLDVGQGIVVSRGTVLAVEAFEGTDAMLTRAGGFDARDTLFVKTVKPGQDYRFDVPVFGMKTLAVMTKARLGAAALEAGNCIILEKERVLAEARRRKITILGY